MRRLLLLALDRLGRTLDRLGRVCLYGAAGLSRIDDMRAGTSAAWNTFLIEDDDIARGWMRWEQSLADRVITSADRVLVIGCGTGRDVIPFIERGCLVTGVDPASEAVDVARRVLATRQLSATLVVGFFEDLALDGPFDVVWFSWFAYSYIPDARRRVGALQRAAGVLAPNGQIVVSVLRHPPASRLLHLAEWLARVSHSDWTVGEGDVFSRIPGSRYLRYEHFFAMGEAEREFEDAGLRIVDTIEQDTVFLLEPRQRA